MSEREITSCKVWRVTGGAPGEATEFMFVETDDLYNPWLLTLHGQHIYLDTETLEVLKDAIEAVLQLAKRGRETRRRKVKPNE